MSWRGRAYELEGSGIPQGDHRSVSVDVSYHKEQYIWFRHGVLNGSWYIKTYELKGNVGLCHWMCLIIRNKYIYGLRAGFWMIPDILSLIWTGMGGVYHSETHGWCHWMHLIIRNKNIYGWGWGSEQFLIYFAFMNRSGGRWHYPGLTPGSCHWMRLIIANNNMYGLGVGIWAVSEILGL